MTPEPAPFAPTRAPDFRPASRAVPRADTFHVILVDWHTVQSPNPAASITVRLRLRDAFIRFLHNLFECAKLLRQPLLLLATSGHDQQQMVRIVQVLEMASPAHSPIASALQSLRAAQQSCAPLSPSALSQYTRSLIDQLAQWGASRSTIPHTYIFSSTCISGAISAALSASESRIFGSDRTHIFPCEAVAEADGHLSEILARLLEHTLTLTLPSDAAASLSLPLNIRPRVLSSTVEYPATLVATRRVALQSIREDFLHGTSLVVWPNLTAAHHMEHSTAFGIVVQKLRDWDEALLCVATGEDSQKLFALIPSGTGMRAALLREAAHAGTVLPVPRSVTTNGASHGAAREVAQELALRLLPSGAYDAQSLRIGGARRRSANAGRRVNFRRG